MNRTKAVVVAALAVAVLIGGVSIYYLSMSKPGFPGSTIGYDIYQLQDAAASGKPTLVYFSTFDCPACLMEDRVIDAVIPDFESNVTFVFMRLSASNGQLFQDWSVLVVPTIVLAGDDGTITKRYDGFVGEDDLRADLERLL